MAAAPRKEIAMTMPLSILPEEEVRRHVPADEEAGFGSLSTSRGHLPLRALDVQARIDGLLSEVRLAQTFVNAFPEPLEATYIFPLPDRAAVTSFRMEVAGRVVEGVLKERGAARREYDVAMRAGQRASIAEEERPGVFSLRVGNIMPGEAATIRLTLAGPVIYDSGEVTFRFPLVVAPRYIPGVALPGESVGAGTVVDTDAVPDASRITPPVLLPGFPNPVRLSLAVEVHPGGLPMSDIGCSLHAAVAEPWEGGFRIVLGPGERLNRDFILRYRLGEDSVRTSLLLLPDRENRQEGTFALTVVPPVPKSQLQKPRDVVFVLDRSGSMGGWKMVAARRALARMVDGLTERDRFTILAFDDQVEVLPLGNGAFVPAMDRQRFRAIEFLSRIDARGGTEMARPLDLAVQQLTGERDRILVLVTDGQVGNEDQILRSLGKRLAGIRIFTLGIDQAVNEAFLKRLAALGGGCCDVVESEDRLDEVMAKVQRRIGTPVLTGLRLEATGLKVDPASVTPPRLPDLFAGVAMTVLGRYQGQAEGSITLQGRDEAGRPWLQSLRSRLCQNSAVSQVWARSQVRALEDRFVIGDGDPAALEKRIVELSLRFGVLCRFTAYVAVDRAESVNEGGRRHQIVQPVEMPAGWEMLGTATAMRSRSVKGCMPAPAAAQFEEDHGDPAFLGGMPAEASPRSRGVARGGGLLRSLFGALRSPGKHLGKSVRELKATTRTPGKVDDGLDLTAYRRRAQDMLEALNKGKGTRDGDGVRGLGILAEKLAALIDDLKSIGAAAAVLRPLEKLCGELQQLLNSEPKDTEVARLWAESEKVLRAFAGVEAAAKVKGR
jgi:Ca-activated chloride channel family protein